MSSFPFRRFVFYSVLVTVLYLQPTAGDRPDSRWIKPGALDRWGQQQRLRPQTTDGEACAAQTEPTQCDCPPPAPPEPTTCSADISEDQRLALVFYRKLIKTLFARDTLSVDGTAEEQDHIYTTSLQLKVSTRQLDKLLDDSCSAREINLIVSAVLEKSALTRRSTIFRENQCERLYNFLMQCFESKVLHNLLPVGLLIAVCYLVRLVARITRMNSFLVLLLLVFSINFCTKWKECNEDLARKSLQHLETPPLTSTLWLRTLDMVGFGTRSDQSALLICDPMQVLIQSTVSIQAEYFKSMFKELLDVFEKSTQGAGWFQKIMTGILLLGFSYMVLTSLLTVGISSGFKMVGTVVSAGLQASRNRVAIDDRTAANNGQQQQLPSVNLNIHIGEGIARTVPLAELLRQESQRIEIVSEQLPEIEESAVQTDTKSDEVPATTTTTASDHLEEPNDDILAKNQTNEEK